MYDLSVTTNLAVFAIMCALVLALVFFAIDIFAVKKPGAALKAVSVVFGVISLIAGLAAGVAAAGLKFGFVTLSGADTLIGSFALPSTASVVTLANYPVTWGLAAALVVLSLLDMISAFARKGRAAQPVTETQSAEATVETQSAVASETPEAFEEPAAQPETFEEPAAQPEAFEEPAEEFAAAQTETASTETSASEQAASAEPPQKAEQGDELVEAALSEASEGRKRYGLDDVRGIMDEISGLVDDMEGAEQSGEEKDEKASPGDDDDELCFGYEPIEGSAREYFSEIPADETDEDEEEDEPPREKEDEKQPEAEKSVPEPPRESEEKEPPAKKEEKAKEKSEPERERESVAAVVPERVGKTLRPSRPREIDEFTTLASIGAEKTPPPVRKVTVKPKSENVKEVEPQIGGLPMTKRHVIINRRNVVNMFSEYLKTKSADEKERIESSINTIIIK